MSNQINNGGPAFPLVYYSEPIGSIGPQLIVKGGMDLRDYFAAAALQGLMGRAWGEVPTKELFNVWAKSSYAIADAMLKAREVKP